MGCDIQRAKWNFLGMENIRGGGIVRGNVWGTVTAVPTQMYLLIYLLTYLLTSCGLH